MDFWEAQKKARKRTSLYIGLFLLMVFGVAIVAELILRNLTDGGYSPPIPLFGLGMGAAIILVALFQYLTYRKQGGGFVARQVGGRKIHENSSDFLENRLYNVAREMATASGEPMPEVYVLDRREINAFAAGLTNDKAAVAVTRGALEVLNREELQGVVAHEFGHIHNGDMKISLQIAAMLMGLFFLSTIGYRILYTSSYSMGRRSGGMMFAGLIALILIIAGSVTGFFGSILRACVSRQREYLADASAVQFTRSTEGIGNALRKIMHQQIPDMPRAAQAYAHLYIDNRVFAHSLFATHPPLKKRIEAIEGRKFLPKEWKSARPKPREKVLF